MHNRECPDSDHPTQRCRPSFEFHLQVSLHHPALFLGDDDRGRRGEQLWI